MNTAQENILNVTLLEPRMKHPTIFAYFDRLDGGETLTILNDHDPKPLYYQLLGERGNIFSWEYAEQGPEQWRVRISKHKSGEPEETLGQLATRDLRKAQVFKKYGLDFCCGGKKTVKQACAEKGIDASVVETELQQAERQAAPSTRPLAYHEWDLGFLADYIVQVHHSYIKKNLPGIIDMTHQVLLRHGAAHTELGLVYELVQAIQAELTEHLQKEEQIIFPFIKSLAVASGASKQFSAPSGTVRNPVKVMEKEHERIGKYLEELRMVTDKYVVPADACDSYNMLYHLLAEFEEDMLQHIHLENNILFAKAIEMEQAA
ncbi:MAG: iron-sulfur cluster repair di-iron protein [Bacteroidetes bacterium]|nr:iron-sulfur cluster repair di-iron protein [Bacteroidota bacterium]